MTLTFVIPALNERGNLERLGEQLNAVVEGLDADASVVLVDDGSTDGTGEAAPEALAPLPVRVVTHPRNLGIARAFHSGFDACVRSGRDDDLVVTLEADGTSDIAELPRLIASCEDADLVLGSCYAPGGGVQGTNLIRHALSGCANALVKAWFGLWGLHTFSSFYRVYRVGALRRVFEASGGDPMREQGFAAVVELLIRMHALGERIREVPVVLRSDERRGHSKMRVLPTIRGYFRVMFLLGPCAFRVHAARSSARPPVDPMGVGGGD